ncbi:unnamed protein product [Caenorhabditis angaria]|uniref:Potassium channel domain-containing protein n=1 Tax=Caenorhabditis angaria TaxID=860376 RepID=A0A9P1ISX3_9PELO|nr:unnamed protein product [Caenorhabditis angaria]
MIEPENVGVKNDLTPPNPWRFANIEKHQDSKNNPETLEAELHVDVFSRAFSSPGALGDKVMPTQKSIFRKCSIYNFLKNHRKKCGFRYFALLFLVVLYTLFGATIFYFIEGTHEKAILKVHEQNLDDLLNHLADDLSSDVNNPNVTFTKQAMKDYIRKAYIDLQKQESQYKWSTYYKLEDPENNMKWTFSSAFFFSMNVYTTTGYGAISAETIFGQSFTMLYAFCFVPLTSVVLRDLGQLLLVKFTWVYAHASICVRKLCKSKNLAGDQIQIQMPVKCCMGIFAIYLLFCTTFVYIYDALSGPKWSDGLPYFTAFYFSFISLTTIGLGDVMPNNQPYSPLISILFFIGMAVVRVVNRSTFIAVENGVFGIMTLVERKIDQKFPPRIEISEASFDSDAELEDQRRQNLKSRPISEFLKSNEDIYGGGFGQVNLRAADLKQLRFRTTFRSVSETIPRNVH